MWYLSFAIVCVILCFFLVVCVVWGVAQFHQNFLFFDTTIIKPMFQQRRYAAVPFPLRVARATAPPNMTTLLLRAWQTITPGCGSRLWESSFGFPRCGLIFSLWVSTTPESSSDRWALFYIFFIFSSGQRLLTLPFLPANVISRIGAVALAAALSHNSNLETLNLSSMCLQPPPVFFPLNTLSQIRDLKAFWCPAVWFFFTDFWFLVFGSTQFVFLNYFSNF